MAYQAWDSLFIYRNDFILFIKLFPVSAVTVTLRETEAQRDLYGQTHQLELSTFWP